MSKSPTPEDDNEILQSFSVSLTVYTKVKKTTQGKATSKEEKSTKTKELLFAINDSNYLEFLRSILHKHGLKNYEVTEKKHFPLKYIPPKAKGQRTSDAIDVDNLSDYGEMVKKIYDESPPVVKLRRVSHSGGPGSENDSEPTTDSSVAKSVRGKKADLDQRLARWRLKLEKMYKNDHDEGLTYVGPLGAVPLTPAMIRDWCIALEDGQATIKVPPNIPSFDLANKAPILHPARKATAHLPSPSVDVNSLTSVLLLQTLTQSGLLTAGQQGTPQGSTVPHTPQKGPATPCTPSRNPVAAPSSPPIPSPSQLTRFLQYAETNLGVRYAMSYKSILEMHRIGPDILLDVDDKLLSEFGISAGDAIRLKKGSMAWWNGPDAKRKRSDASASAEDAQQPAIKKRVSYNKKYHEGGGCRFTGPPMRKDDRNPDFQPELDYDFFYYCDTQKQWLPVPAGFVVDEDEPAD
ncbi:hypothetical protein BKA83DRAFT_4120971 [Pisolithus microcarpus]|nr:hypothetical protein BKA83DRAFT_4120971 [Pisolithus microcarpus]